MVEKAGASLLENRDDKRRLAAHVLVERSARDLRGSCQTVYARRGEAVVVEDAISTRDDLRPNVHRLLMGWTVSPPRSQTGRANEGGCHGKRCGSGN